MKTRVLQSCSAIIVIKLRCNSGGYVQRELYTAVYQKGCKKVKTNSVTGIFACETEGLGLAELVGLGKMKSISNSGAQMKKPPVEETGGRAERLLRGTAVGAANDSFDPKRLQVLLQDVVKLMANICTLTDDDVNRELRIRHLNILMQAAWEQRRIATARRLCKWMRQAIYKRSPAMNEWLAARKGLV